MTYADYYKNKYDKEVTDMKQPLLCCLVRKKERHGGGEETIYLVPEFCQLTGLTDQMRENFSLMKELSKHLHMGPQDRVKEINTFMEKLQTTKEV